MTDAVYVDQALTCEQGLKVSMTLTPEFSCLIPLQSTKLLYTLVTLYWFGIALFMPPGET